MPLYVYQCPECTKRLGFPKRFEKYRPIGNRENRPFCPKCGTPSDFVPNPPPDIKTRKVPDVFKKV